jgi:gamma-glutamyltranspeptidase/glutathione hydrolase
MPSWQPAETVEELRRRGHQIQMLPPFGGSGHAQVIMIHPESGAFIAGSDPRCDGCAMGW